MGRLLGWDGHAHERPDLSYVARLDADLASLSLVPPGTPDGAFRIFYQLSRETVAEIRNATVHAFMVSVLEETASGYRLYAAGDNATPDGIPQTKFAEQLGT